MERQREAVREEYAGSVVNEADAGAGRVEAKTSGRGWRFMASAVAAGLLVAGLAAWQLQPAGLTSDQGLSVAEKEARQQTFEAQGMLRLPKVAAADVARALDSLQLPPRDRAALEQDLAGGKASLAWLTVWDDQAEDGDVVRLDGQGLSRTISITHAPQTLAVPLSAAGSFQLSGVRDGGGGITVAVKANGRDVALPVLSVGEAFAIAVGL